MRFKIDENLHDDAAALFASAGHDVHTVYDEGLRGSTDEMIAQRCQSEDRVLVTLDLDFADIRTYPRHNQPGMIVLRVGSQSRAHILHVLSRVVALLASELVADRLWIVSEGSVRIRQ